jgi:hypothetical protein
MLLFGQGETSIAEKARRKGQKSNCKKENKNDTDVPGNAGRA